MKSEYEIKIKLSSLKEVYEKKDKETEGYIKALRWIIRKKPTTTEIYEKKTEALNKLSYGEELNIKRVNGFVNALCWVVEC